MVTICAKRGNGNSDRNFGIIACGREALGGGYLITKTKLVCNDQGEEKYNSKVYNQWSGDRDDGRCLMNDLMSLRSEKDEDSKETDQRPRSRRLQEYLIITGGTNELAKGETGNNSCSKRYNKEDRNASCYRCIRDRDTGIGVADKFDE